MHRGLGVRKGNVAARFKDDALPGTKERDCHTYILEQLFFTKLVN